MVTFREHGNEHSGSTERGKFLDKLSDSFTCQETLRDGLFLELGCLEADGVPLTGQIIRFILKVM